MSPRAQRRRANARRSRSAGTLLLFGAAFALIAASGLFVDGARLAWPDVWEEPRAILFTAFAIGSIGLVFYFREKRVFD